MVTLAPLLSRGQQKGEVSPPCSGVLSAPKATNLGCIEDCLNAPAYATSRLGFGCPDRRKDAQDVFDRDLIDGPIPDRCCISSECVPPLLAMLGVFPDRLVCFDMLDGGRAKVGF